LLAVSALAMAATSISAAEIANSRPVTFTKDIAPIFQAKCEECHRPGTASPMSLITYSEVRPWARSIKTRVTTRSMPPWHIDKTSGIKEFANDRSLTDEQIDMIARWVDSGAPQGDAKDMPAPRKWPDGNDWVTVRDLGQPDIVVKSANFTVPAQGQDTWLKPMTPIGITEERWVRAVEIRPSTLAGRKVVHHVRADLEQDDPEFKEAGFVEAGTVMPPAGVLMEWAIGKQNDVYEKDSGKLLVPGAQVRWDLHLHSIGEQISDHVELGIWLYPKGQKPSHRTNLMAFPGYKGDIDIAPNSISQTSNITVLKQAARLQNFQPHMHLRGKAMLMEAILPDGEVRTLSYVDHFNFQWMNNYIYTEESAPVLPKGTMIRVTAWHDNTTANKDNPNHDAWVGYGDRTVDEMAHAWVNVNYISDAEYNEWRAKHSPNKGQERAEK